VNKEEIILASREYLFPSVFHYFAEPLVIERAKDQFVWDADGNEYLDFFGGILTVSVGIATSMSTRKCGASSTKFSMSRLFSRPSRRRLWRRKLRRLRRVICANRFLRIAERKRTRRPLRLRAALPARAKSLRCGIPIMGARARHGDYGNAAWKTGPQVLPGIVHAHNAYCYRCPFGQTYPDCACAAHRIWKN